MIKYYIKRDVCSYWMVNVSLLLLFVSLFSIFFFISSISLLSYFHIILSLPLLLNNLWNLDSLSIFLVFFLSPIFPVNSTILQKKLLDSHELLLFYYGLFFFLLLYSLFTCLILDQNANFIVHMQSMSWANLCMTQKNHIWMLLNGY